MRSFTALVMAFSLAAPIGLLVTGCQTTVDDISEVGTAIGVATGAITTNEAASIKRTAKALDKTFTRLTPEQEHYIGRSVIASILKTYQPLDNKALTRYVNVIGQSLAQASNRPETFAGYHFLALDTDEINAFAAPGGLILITRGMLGLCESEDDLAAVLAHEIGHVAGRHGLRSINKDRMTKALAVLLDEGARQLGNEEIVQLTDAFQGAVSEVTDTLIRAGYARELELEADQSAVSMLKQVGYDSTALANVLMAMDKQFEPNGAGFATTHPNPVQRVARIESAGENVTATPAPDQRLKRFQEATADL